MRAPHGEPLRCNAVAAPPRIASRSARVTSFANSPTFEVPLRVARRNADAELVWERHGVMKTDGRARERNDRGGFRWASGGPRTRAGACGWGAMVRSTSDCRRDGAVPRTPEMCQDPDSCSAAKSTLIQPRRRRGQAASAAAKARPCLATSAVSRALILTALHCRFSLQIFHIAEDRGNC